MARSDLLIDLVKAEGHGDKARFRALVEAVIAEERAKSHHVLADRLSALITTSGSHERFASEPIAPSVRELVFEINPQRRLCDLVLTPEVTTSIRELIEEHHRCDLLLSYNLEPRHRVLLAGPPGNGKTSLAEVIAAETMLPMYVARYEGIVSSFLGEPASRTEEVFEFVRTRRCVLFFDEFDTIAKERADEHETGEIKRVVSTLLLQIDRLPAHVIVVCATNHSELLDRAAWRRFQICLSVDEPTRARAIAFLEKLSDRYGGELGLSPSILADRLAGSSYSELEQFALDVRRRYVLELPDVDVVQIANNKVNQWQTQARN